MSDLCASASTRTGYADLSMVLSGLQRSMVLGSLRAPGSGVYVVQDVCELENDIDATRLRAAWRRVAERHPVLRSSIDFEAGQPVGLRVAADPVLDWRDIGETSLASFLELDRAAGFDLTRGVPIRVASLRSAEGHFVVCTSHHALLDGRSYLMVWKEWLDAYHGLTSSTAATFASRTTPSAVDDSQAEGFWRQAYSGISQTEYIVDRIRTAAASESSEQGRASIVLPKEVTGRLRKLAEHCGVSLNNLIQAAWAMILSRYGGRNEVVFGVTRSGRSSLQPDEDPVGFFINTLPMRLDVEPQAPFKFWLQAVRLCWTRMREYERTPLEQVSKWSGLPSGMPPFDSVIVYDHEPPEQALRMMGVREVRSFRRFQRTDWPLTLAAYGGETLTLDLIFSTQLYCQEMIADVALNLRRLLECFDANPADTVYDVLRASAERAPLTGVPEACPASSAHHVFEQRVQETPGACALEWTGGSMTYDEVNRRANQLASLVRQAGIQPNEFVAVCTGAVPEIAIAFLAVLKAGAAFVPIDPALPRDRLASMIRDTKARLVLAMSTTAGLFDGEGYRALQLDRMDEDLAPLPSENLPNVAAFENAAYAIYTSGSTGTPKAAVLPHRALAHHTVAAIEIFGIGPGTRRLQFASTGTDMIVAEVFNYLCGGGSIVFGWRREGASVREFIEALRDRKITITGIPSAWWNEWVAALESEGTTLPPTLRTVVIGMEKVSPATFRKWQRAVGTRVRLFNAYGPTEASPVSTIYEAGTSAWESDSYVPIGRPLPRVKLDILSASGVPVPMGVAGELFIGGPGVGLGYLNSQAQTDNRFVKWSFGDGDLGYVYRTGDIVFRLPDGNLVFVGRSDRQVKVRGYRVELEEIESALSGHPNVAQCAVLAVEREGKNELIAYVAPEDLNASKLRIYLAKRLPEHMVPPVIVSSAELPVTANGKIDRQALQSVTHQSELTIPEHVPMTATESRLAGIWEEILKRRGVGPFDNFFELGADSLDATRLIASLESQFGHIAPLSLLWRNPTLARMAALIDGHPSGQAAEAIVALQSGGDRTPFFCFPGADENPYYFRALAQALGPDQPFLVVRDVRPLNDRGSFTVEDAAQRYVATIRSYQPQGPYLVGGHCYGGVVAFEVARQLKAAGEEIAKVLLFEVATPGYPKVLRHWKKYSRLAWGILHGRQRIGVSDIRAHSAVLRRLFFRKASVVKRRTLIATGLKNVVPPIARTEHPNARAGRSYKPSELACDVVQFIAAGENHSTQLLDDPRLGWKDFARGQFSVCPVPGGAAEIFRRPYVFDLAAAVTSVLDADRSHHIDRRMVG